MEEKEYTNRRKIMNDEMKVPEEVTEGENTESEYELESYEAEGEMLSSVSAKEVHLMNGGAQHIEANTVTIENGAAAQVEAHTVSVTSGAIAMVQAQQVSLNNGVAAVVGGESLIIENSKALVIGCGDAKMTGPLTAGVMGCGDLDAESVKAVFLAAGDIKADEVNTVFTPLTAGILGAALGLVFAGISILFKVLSKDDEE
jgi:hypothetical protein